MRGGTPLPPFLRKIFNADTLGPDLMVVLRAEIARDGLPPALSGAGLCQVRSLDKAGDEGLLGVGGCQGVEGELAAGTGAELEEQAGAVGVIGVDGIDEAHPGGAVEV